MIIYLDTETTGLYPGQICQLAYIIQNGKNVSAKNFFFAVDDMPYGAFLVHGFSKEKLLELSCGKRFCDHVKEIKDDFEKADLIVAHNVNFDFMFLRAEFNVCGLDFVYKREYCTMKNLTPVCKLLRSSGKGYKYPKLVEACNHFGVTDTEIKQDVMRFFGTELDYHDARFDTVALYLIANRGLEYDMEKYL